MAILDIVILIIILYFSYRGFKNGLIKEFGSLIALIAGIFLAIRFSDFIGSLLTEKGGFSSEYMPVIAFTVIFVGIVVVVILFAKILDQFMKIIKLQWINKLGGIIFSLLKTIIILGGLFFVTCQFNQRIGLFDEEVFDKSLLFEAFIQVFEFVFPYAEHLYHSY